MLLGEMAKRPKSQPVLQGPNIPIASDQIEKR
jgi:hypothetical protein